MFSPRSGCARRIMVPGGYVFAMRRSELVALDFDTVTFALFETDVRRERQNEDIAKAKAEGKYKGRPQTVDREAIAALCANGVFKIEIAARLGIARLTVYMLIEEVETEKGG